VGGTYTVKGDTYAETPIYGIGEDFDHIRDQTHTFTWRGEGNKWYLNGQLAGGLVKIEEVWENVNPEATMAPH
jgi:hypothetical protein